MNKYSIGYIYAIENTLDTNVYIGSTIKPIEQRFMQHKRSAKRSPECVFHKYMALHGCENFFITVIHTEYNVSIRQLQMLERSYIKGYGLLNTVHSKSEIVVPEEVLDAVGRKSKNKIFESEYPKITLDYIFEKAGTDYQLSFIELRDKIFDDTNNMSKVMDDLCPGENLAIHTSVLEWLGYDSEKDRNNKDSFIQLLNAHSIDFKQIKHTDPSFENYPDLVEEASILSVAALKRKKWIIMASRDFKKMVMCLRTSRAEQIREYYLAIEDLFKMYCEYTLHFQLRREKRRLGKKQGTIDDLVRGMEEMKLERKEAERRYNNLMARGDDLLHHAEQAEEDRIAMMSDLNCVRRAAAPNPEEPNNVHRMAVVKMSPNYEWEEGDPKYYANIDALAIRTQIKYFTGRVNKIKSAGAGSNSGASILTSFDSPNPISLFNRLKENNSDKFTFVQAAGIRYEPSTESDLVEAVNEIHESRMNYPN